MRSLFKILRFVQRIQSNECTCLRTSVGQTKSSGTPVEPIGEPVSYSRSQTKVNGFLQLAAIPIKSKTLYPFGLTRKVSFQPRLAGRRLENGNIAPATNRNSRLR